MKKEYAEMTKDELRAELARLAEDLEDMEATFTFNLTNTTAHLRSGMVAEHEDEIAEIRANMARVEGLLAA